MKNTFVGGSQTTKFMKVFSLKISGYTVSTYRVQPRSFNIWGMQSIACPSASYSQLAANPGVLTSVSDFSLASEDSIFLKCLEFVHPVSIEPAGSHC